MLSPLAQARLFSALPVDGRAVLAQQGRERAFLAGEALARQGSVTESSFLIVRGCVRVERSHPDLSEPVVLGELWPGEIVGRVGLLDGDPFEATFTATEDTQVVELGPDAVTRAVLPLLDGSETFLHLLSVRLTSRDELLNQLAQRGWMAAQKEQQGDDSPVLRSLGETV